MVDLISELLDQRKKLVLVHAQEQGAITNDRFVDLEEDARLMGLVELLELVFGLEMPFGRGGVDVLVKL